MLLRRAIAPIGKNARLTPPSTWLGGKPARAMTDRTTSGSRYERWLGRNTRGAVRLRSRSSASAPASASSWYARAIQRPIRVHASTARRLWPAVISLSASMDSARTCGAGRPVCPASLSTAASNRWEAVICASTSRGERNRCSGAAPPVWST